MDQALRRHAPLLARDAPTVMVASADIDAALEANDIGWYGGQ